MEELKTEPMLYATGKYDPVDVARYQAELLAIIEAVRAAPSVDARVLRHILRRYPRDGSGSSTARPSAVCR